MLRLFGLSFMGLMLCFFLVSSQSHPPQLVFDASVAPDLQELAKETWRVFLDVFAKRTNCFGDVRLVATRHLNDRAVYDPQSATVTLRVPGTSALLREALVHEWAHHVEFQCPEQQTMRADFLLAQGLPAETLWRDNKLERPWAEIPSEQYAEATIQLVLGRQQIPTAIQVSAEAVTVIEEWVNGEQ